jgi:hypothetical protein
LFEIERNVERRRFDEWFNASIDIEPSTQAFLSGLIDDTTLLIDSYGEEDLKINFIGPLLKHVRFTSYEKRIREFYEVSMTYVTDRNFSISNGEKINCKISLLQSENFY